MDALSLIKKLREATSAPIAECKKAIEEAKLDYELAKDILKKRGKAIMDKRGSKEATCGLYGYEMNESRLVILRLSCETDFVSTSEMFQDLMAKLLKLTIINNCPSVDAILSTEYEGSSGLSMIEEATTSLGEKISIDRIVEYSLDENLAAVYVHNKASKHKNLGLMISAVIFATENKEASNLELARQIAMHVAASNPICLSVEQIPAETIAKERAIYMEQMQESNKPAEIINKIIEGKMVKFYEENVLMEQNFIMDDSKKIKQILDSKLTLKSFVRMQI